MKEQELTQEDQRILLGDLTPKERETFRKTEDWETCFQAWLESEKPSVIRGWLAGPREELLQYIDSKGIEFLKAVELSKMDEVDALKFVFPRITGETDQTEDPTAPELEEDQDEEELPQDLREKAELLLEEVQE